MVLRILNALLDDLTRLAYMGVFFVTGIVLVVFLLGLFSHLLYGAAVSGWMLGTFVFTKI